MGNSKDEFVNEQDGIGMFSVPTFCAGYSNCTIWFLRKDRISMLEELKLISS